MLEITTGCIYVARIAALQKWKNRAGTCSTYRNLLQICVTGEWHDSAMIIVGLFKDSVGKFQILKFIFPITEFSIVSVYLVITFTTHNI